MAGLGMGAFWGCGGTSASDESLGPEASGGLAAGGQDSASAGFAPSGGRDAPVAGSGGNQLAGGFGGGGIEGAGGNVVVGASGGVAGAAGWSGGGTAGASGGGAGAGGTSGTAGAGAAAGSADTGGTGGAAGGAAGTAGAGGAAGGAPAATGAAGGIDSVGGGGAGTSGGGGSGGESGGGGGQSEPDLCSASRLASDISPLDDVMAGALYAASPPTVETVDADLMVTDSLVQTILYAHLLESSPVVFASEPFAEITYWYSLDCMVRPENGSNVMGFAIAGPASSVESGVAVDVGSTGYFWSDSDRCSVYAYRESLRADHVVIGTASSRFLRQMPLAFSGEIVDLPEDTPPGEDWSMRQLHTARVDTVYWNHGDVSLGETVQTEVIGWIGPKQGPLTFWAKPIGDEPIVLTSYISAQPRSAFFCPLGGRYAIEIQSVEFLQAMSEGSGETWCYYNVEGSIVDTLQGRIRTGEFVSFSYTNPPTLQVGSAYLFEGVPSGDSQVRLLNAADLPPAACPP